MHYRNYNKRLIKSPKLYFCDTGLACLLAGIQNKKQLMLHPMRGAFFETWVVSELLKNRFNKGLLSNLYFWRDSQGHEVDIILEEGNELIPIEVKAGQTISNDYFAGLEYWKKLTGQTSPASIIYAGNQSQSRSNIEVIGWQDIHKLFV